MDQKNMSPRGQGAAGAAAARGGGYQITAFPPEFERHILQDLDRRFYIILIVALVVVYGIVFTLASIKYDTAKLDEQARQRYLEKFYQAALVTDEMIAEEEKTDELGMGEEEEEQKVDERASAVPGPGW